MVAPKGVTVVHPRRKFCLAFLSWILQVMHHIDAPACLKKQLDTVISLQSDLDTTEKALQSARGAIEKDLGASESLDVLNCLERTYGRLMDKVESLYASLMFRINFLNQMALDSSSSECSF